ncbi:hypothetical protein HPB49_000405 [Dermacentor silvarum]|uniref:Uncharacterized protein n=1 Tax=Dermacentor silvarum TaxID=543639 RepID=A0ACB8CTZ7_DERSI|nr:hypothetical protein HPB49_000405 [Dermacentor silvarum]
MNVAKQRKKAPCANSAKFQQTLKTPDVTRLGRVRKAPSVRYVETARMPTAQGYLEGQPVTVLRDSGCDTVIVKRAPCSSRETYWENADCYLLDSSAQHLPEAEVDIDCPFYKGTVLVICMETATV